MHPIIRISFEIYGISYSKICISIQKPFVLLSNLLIHENNVKFPFLRKYTLILPFIRATRKMQEGLCVEGLGAKNNLV